MDLATLFRTVKSNIQDGENGDLIKASELANNADLKKHAEETGFNLVPYDEMCRICEKFDVNPEHMYIISSNSKSISAYYYYDFPVFIEIHVMSEDAFKTFEVAKRIQFQSEKFKKLLKNKQYETFFALVDERIRITALHKIYEEMPQEERYKHFIDIYTKLEFGFNHFEKELIDDAISNQPVSVKKTLKENLNTLSTDDELVIYRGMGDFSTPINKAYSWTLNLRVADMFANRMGGRFSETDVIYTAKVKKADVIDFLVKRNEDEILVRPWDVYNVQKYDYIKVQEQIDSMGNNGYLYWYNTFKNRIKDELFHNPNGDHGVLHTKRVLFNVLSLCNEFELDDLDTSILCLAAVYHDIGREHDDVDDLHGEKSWDKLSELNIIEELQDNYKIYEEDLEIIRFLMKHHCLDDDVALEKISELDTFKTYEEVELLFNIFKDADGLDRMRFDDLNTRYLRLEESKKRVSFARNVIEFINRDN
ncbi:HD domain-containing protein [Priestia filamentosa]|uniref:HD domain-containing protein n=1 Tax=Priestia filamentosa TaxID=1402861 RepID=UPI003978EF0C